MPVKNIRELKTGLRAKYRSIRESLDPAVKAEMDGAVLEKLLSLREYKVNPTIFTYVSKSIEVDTFGLIEASLQAGKKVAAPRCVPGTYDMEFFYISSVDDLEKGMFGVLEPNPERCKKVEDFSRGFCVVPGLCFDVQGFRLGYGKGYYDRFLSRFGGFTAGISYASCVQWNLPHGFYDRPVDVLVTEKYIRKTARRRGKGGKA